MNVFSLAVVLFILVVVATITYYVRYIPMFRAFWTGSYPPRWARAITYAFTWLPVFVLLIWFVPQFEKSGIFQKLEEKGTLPLLSQLLLDFVRMDAAFFFLPIVLVAVVLLAFDEAATSVLHRQVMGKLWSRLGWLQQAWRE